MSFTEKIRTLSGRAAGLVSKLETEEATKNALVMPFLSALGYDVFNPEEVVPEFTADVGTKRGEKVDYAIMRDGAAIILVEAKRAGATLCLNHASQLYRYFSVSHARIAILTNGTEFQLYTDLDQANRMDERPFLEIDLLDVRWDLVDELEKITKDAFDLDGILSTAGSLKHVRSIRKAIEAQMEAPEEDLVRFFHAKACPSGRFTQAARDEFTALVRNAFSEVLSERVSRRLRGLLESEGGVQGASTSTPAPAEDESATAKASASDEGRGVVTTEEEREAFRVVRAIVCSVLPIERIAHRDTKSYFGVLCDDNNRKPICRFHLNHAQWYLGTFDAEKKETRHPISAVTDIYQYAEQLREAARRYVAA